MSNEVTRYSVPEMERMAVAIAKSGLFAAKTPEAALTLMLVAQSEGIHPAQAFLEYDVINNRPALKSAAMLARFQASGGKVKWLKATDEEVSGEFSHPSGGTITVTWNEDRIKKAGLAGRENHQKYPTQMKRARCVSEAVRALFPASIPVGFYSTEETQDMIDVTPAQPATGIVTLWSAAGSAAGAAAGPAAPAVTPCPSSAAIDIETALREAETPETLKVVWSKGYQALWDADDMAGLKLIKAAHDARKAELAKAA